LQLTNHQRKQIYNYWRSQGLDSKTANKYKNSIFKVYAHAADLKRFGLKNKAKASNIQLTKTQLKQQEAEIIKHGVNLSEISLGKMKPASRVKYLARVKGYLKAVGKKSKRAPKKLLDEFRKRLEKATSEVDIYKMIQESYSQGLQPTIELTVDGIEKIRI